MAESAEAPAPTLAAPEADAANGGVIGDPPADTGEKPPSEKPRRKRRTKAEMEEARAAEAAAVESGEAKPRTRRPRKPKEEVAETAEALPGFIADPAE